MQLVVLVPLLAVGLVSFVFVRSEQDSGALLLDRQEHAGVLTPGAVAKVVQAAPDPVTRAKGVSARCRAEGRGDLRNPWRCSITYRSGRIIRYHVTIAANGAYSGDHELVRFRGLIHSDTGTINGCCVAIP